MGLIKEEIVLDYPRRYLPMHDAANPLASLGTDGIAGPSVGGTPGFRSTDESQRNAIKFSGDDFTSAASYVMSLSQTNECWLKFSTATAGQEEMILNADHTTGRRFFRIMKIANGGLGAYIFYGGNGGPIYISTAIDLRDNAWHHVVLRWVWVTATSTLCTLWVDGVQRASGTLSGGQQLTSTDTINISQETGFSGGVKYVGLMKHVAFYNYALSDARIAAHAAATDEAIFLGAPTLGVPSLNAVMARYLRTPLSTVTGGSGGGGAVPTFGQLWPRH